MKPTIGGIVHYRSYGTPGGEYTAQCRAAVVTEVYEQLDAKGWKVGLAVLNPEGMFFNRDVRHDVTCSRGGMWHWPEREDSDG